MPFRNVVAPMLVLALIVAPVNAVAGPAPKKESPAMVAIPPLTLREGEVWKSRRVVWPDGRITEETVGTLVVNTPDGPQVLKQSAQIGPDGWTYGWSSGGSCEREDGPTIYVSVLRRDRAVPIPREPRPPPPVDGPNDKAPPVRGPNPHADDSGK